MTLKEFLDLDIIGHDKYDNFNLNTDPTGAYGYFGHDFKSLYFNQHNELKKIKKYMKCEITGIYGFDDGLTIIVNGRDI